MAIFIAGVLGWGMCIIILFSSRSNINRHLAINMSLAFCMGTDIQALVASPQPMAQIFSQGFGQKGTLAIWAFVVLAQYVDVLT
jgi:hypothetical protein